MRKRKDNLREMERRVQMNTSDTSRGAKDIEMSEKWVIWFPISIISYILILFSYQNNNKNKKQFFRQPIRRRHMNLRINNLRECYTKTKTAIAIQQQGSLTIQLILIFWKPFSLLNQKLKQCPRKNWGIIFSDDILNGFSQVTRFTFDQLKINFSTFKFSGWLGIFSIE